MEPNNNWMDSLSEGLVVEDGFPVVSPEFTDLGVQWSSPKDHNVADALRYDDLVRRAEAKFYRVFKELGMEGFSAAGGLWG